MPGPSPQRRPLDLTPPYEHIAFEVYAAPVQDSDDYFRGLRGELEEALQEGVILIERQQVTLI